MRFPTAWAAIAAQNVTLKVAVLALSLTCVVFGVTSAKLALKAPLVIERACYSSSMAIASPNHTPAEIEAFLKEALAQRFNSDAIPKEGFVSSDELKFRTQEQAELKKRDMSQRVLLNPPVKIAGSSITADTDRLISVGKVRSAFPFQLAITISQTTRTESNPYGLVIEKISQPTGGGLNDSTGK